MTRDWDNPRPAERACRLCGCTQNHACVDDERGACSWVRPAPDPSPLDLRKLNLFDMSHEADLCSHCADSIALLNELITGISPTDRIERAFDAENVGEISLPMHHAEQLQKIFTHLRVIDVGAPAHG
jgi:hypothetical protein